MSPKAVGDSTISISSQSHNNTWCTLRTKNAFMNTAYVRLLVDDDKIVITRPALDYTGKTLQPHDHHNGWRSISINDERVAVGRYHIDEEESDEDQLVIYLDDKIDDDANGTND